MPDSIIDAVKRLERAGDDLSKTNERLRRAAAITSRFICNLVEAGDPDKDLSGAALPRGYVFDLADWPTGLLGPAPEETSFYWLAKKDSLWEVPVHTRASLTRQLASDLATGWMNEVLSWVQSERQGQERFLEIWESAFEKVGEVMRKESRPVVNAREGEGNA